MVFSNHSPGMATILSEMGRRLPESPHVVARGLDAAIDVRTRDAGPPRSGPTGPTAPRVLQAEQSESGEEIASDRINGRSPRWH